MENLGNNILKRIPGCENMFVAPSGQIRGSSQSGNHPYPPPRFQNFQPPRQNRSQPQHNRLPQYGQSQQFQHFEKNPRPAMAMPLHLPYPQHQQSQINQAQPVLDYNAVTSQNMKAPSMYHSAVPSFPTQPPAAVPQPQAVIAPTPLQDLLGNLDNLYEQPLPSGPSRQTAPDLHLLQPAVPHYDHAEQLHHQHSQAWQVQHSNQVRGHNSDSD